MAPGLRAAPCDCNRDTPGAELNRESVLRDLVTGRFDRFPAAFYEQRLAIAQQKLFLDPQNWEAYGKGASALEQLGRTDEAQALLDAMAEALDQKGQAAPAEARQALAFQRGTIWLHAFFRSPSEATLERARRSLEQAEALRATEVESPYPMTAVRALRVPRGEEPLGDFFGLERFLRRQYGQVSFIRGLSEAELAGRIRLLSAALAYGPGCETPLLLLTMNRAFELQGTVALAPFAALRCQELLPLEERAMFLEEAWLLSRLESTDSKLGTFFQQIRDWSKGWQVRRWQAIEEQLAKGWHPDSHSEDFWEPLREAGLIRY